MKIPNCYERRKIKMTIIKIYTNRGLELDYTSADEITKIELYDEESEKLIKEIKTDFQN